MEGRRAYISKDGNGRVKLEYGQNGELRAKLWETKGSKTLETLFDSDGSILVQKVLALNGSELTPIIDHTAKEERIIEMEERAYEHVKLNRPCPKCGRQGLSRHADAFANRGEVPIMPLYHCGNCNTTSYHMTEMYLKYLVDNNRELFDGAEIKEYESNKEAFMAELRGYIIRIFASKKIMCIK